MQDTAEPTVPTEAHQVPSLRLQMLQPSPTNPRKRISAASIAELAETIVATGGVMAPVLARPRPGATPGEVPFELVFGERRWRACNLLTEQGRNPHGDGIPCQVRPLTNAQVLAMQLAENVHREDLHPLDEADHYALMQRDAESPLTPAQIAAATQVPEARVVARLVLLQLVPAAREHFLADRLFLSTATQVARMPAAVQAEIAQHLSNWGGEPMGPKAAAAFIRERFMLRLSSAPFDAADATLYPAAGACGECPKRTGASPQLFADITEADTCTDTACFTTKKIAQRDRLVAELQDTGYTVLRGDQARDVCTSDGRGLKAGMHLLEHTVPSNLGDPTLKIVEVLERAQTPNSATRVVDHPGNPLLVYAVPTPELEAALRKIKKHREQLDKAAQKAAAKAPAPAPTDTPAAAPAPAPTGTDGEERDAFGFPFSSWGKPGAEDAAPADATANTGPSEELVQQLLAFTPPPTVAGLYHGKTLAKYTLEQEQRAFGILVAAQAVRLAEQDMHLLPSLFLLAPLLNLALIEGAETTLQYAEIAQLMGVDYPAGGNAAEWASELGPDDQALLVVLQLALQTSSGDDEFCDLSTKVAVLMDMQVSNLWEHARATVAQHLQLGAIQQGSKAKAGKSGQSGKKDGEA